MTPRIGDSGEAAEAETVEGRLSPLPPDRENQFVLVSAIELAVVHASLSRSVEAVASRRGRQDHAHGLPGSDGELLAPAISIAACSRAAFGSGPYPSRGAHVHPDRAIRSQASPDAAD